VPIFFKRVGRFSTNDHESRGGKQETAGTRSIRINTAMDTSAVKLLAFIGAFLYMFPLPVF
jgi:hypothetical protein